MRCLRTCCLVIFLLLTFAIKGKTQSRFTIAPYFGIGQTSINMESDLQIPRSVMKGNSVIGYNRTPSYAYGVEVKYRFYEQYSLISGVSVLHQNYVSLIDAGKVSWVTDSVISNDKYASVSLLLPLLFEKSFDLNKQGNLTLSLKAGLALIKHQLLNSLFEIENKSFRVERGVNEVSGTDTSFDYLVINHESTRRLKLIPQIGASISYKVSKNFNLTMGFRDLPGFDRIMQTDITFYENINDDTANDLWNYGFNKSYVADVLNAYHQNQDQVRLTSNGHTFYCFAQIQWRL